MSFQSIAGYLLSTVEDVVCRDVEEHESLLPRQSSEMSRNARVDLSLQPILDPATEIFTLAAFAGF